MFGRKDNFAWVKEPEPCQKNLERFFPGGNVGPLKSRGALLCLDKLLWCGPSITAREVVIKPGPHPQSSPLAAVRWGYG